MSTPKTRKLTVRVTEADWTRLQAVARQRDIATAQIIRELIRTLALPEGLLG